MALSGSAELPLCPICCDFLGKYGGPSTLPCGHNGCLDCFKHMKSHSPQCPLCRAPFDPRVQLACNHELKDLIELATKGLMDDKTRAEGWEAFPTANVTNEHYALQVQSEQQHQYQQQQQQPLSFMGYYGPPQQQQMQQQQQQLRHYGGSSIPSSSSLTAASSSSNVAAESSLHGGGGGGLIAGARMFPGPSAAPAGSSAVGLGALIGGSSGSNGSSSRGALHQYHELYHQHPGLPTSAPSGAQSNILTWEPPQWLPDSYAVSCGGCHQPFKPLVRLRHHCRLCGKVFCDACSHRRMLMPPRFRQRDPQRCCDMCASLLEPLQAFLIGATAASVQPPVHDALDAVSLRSWLNSPWGGCMAGEIYKGANILRMFNEALRPEAERGVPTSLLRGVRGLALISVLRLGAGWSATAGTGLVVARQRNGTWSAPCAISCYGMGWGLSLGGQLTDVLLVLRTDEAVRAFASGKTLGLGGACGLAVGPLGRSAEASLRVGGLAAKGSVAGYSCSKGAFAGMSLEGTVTCCRDAVNRAFYGYAVTPRQLLVDCSVPQPPAAALLYQRLDGLMALWENRGSLVHTDASTAAAAAASTSCCKSAARQQHQQEAAAAAAAACGSSSRAAAEGQMLSSSNDSSRSREWDMVGGYAAHADALDQFDDHDNQQQQQWQQQGQQQQQHRGSVQVSAEEEDPAAGFENSEDSEVDEFLASAPPAPTSILHGWLSSSSSRQQGSAAAAGSNSHQQQQQQGSGGQQVQQRADESPEEEDESSEEPQYVLEW